MVWIEARVCILYALILSNLKTLKALNYVPPADRQESNHCPQF
jgi:hypothetical protein